jgi:hypothetical protein
MYLKGFVRYHKLNVTIFLFLFLFTLVHLLKPGLVCEKDGSFREFGVGYRHKTVIPIWVVSIVLAILSYIAVSWYLIL